MRKMWLVPSSAALAFLLSLPVAFGAPQPQQAPTPPSQPPSQDTGQQGLPGNPAADQPIPQQTDPDVKKGSEVT